MQTLTRFQEWTTAWLLSQHPDPGLRDPAKTLEILAAWKAVENPFSASLAAGALVQLGRPQEALIALDRGGELGDIRINRRAMYAAIRARAHFDLEDLERAEHYFKICEAILEDIMYDGMEPWSRADFVRWHRETAQLLGH